VPTGQVALDGLVALLDLERLEVNLFRGVSPPHSPTRVFGGQVAAQALVAAGRTVDPDRFVHSLHAYFVRPGDPRVPIVYEVERVRDGRSFTTRRALAVQHGETIFALSASFQLPQGGLEHTEPAATGVPAPDDLSLVGYNDIPVVSRLPVPLTTVRVPFPQIAANALELLRDADNDNPPRDLIAAPTLIPRKSTIACTP